MAMRTIAIAHLPPILPARSIRRRIISDRVGMSFSTLSFWPVNRVEDVRN
jgi:hypothetical protein